ncbi:hypothetical protein TAGGR_1943 [Thermodesulfovibrio aggregans]|uniref:DUF1640 domain-containing protein n=1 Tax=Thermodesulfovibrio aggregans TaxID=86166 RepID=A0A0U9I9S4_9BACT|nr:hypothetical protein [Thermodesulfovibrio aggregans]GAQ94758.1 hypothetical protein TAGGR_1943 [Thermodesulfovibrio aggregans]
MPEVIEKISKQELEAIVKEIIEDFVRQNEQRAKELSIIERVIRVEEELKALREIENARFEAMEKRFEALQREMKAYYEATDKRFEAMEKRFEAMDKRFEAMDKRFEAMEKRFQFLQWFMGAGFTFISILIAIFGLIRH